MLHWLITATTLADRPVQHDTTRRFLLGRHTATRHVVLSRKAATGRPSPAAASIELPPCLSERVDRALPRFAQPARNPQARENLPRHRANVAAAAPPGCAGRPFQHRVPAASRGPHVGGEDRAVDLPQRFHPPRRLCPVRPRPPEAAQGALLGRPMRPQPELRPAPIVGVQAPPSHPGAAGQSDPACIWP